MIKEWLAKNTPTDCDGMNNTTLKRSVNGEILGRRQTIKSTKRKARKLQSLQREAAVSRKLMGKEIDNLYKSGYTFYEITDIINDLANCAR
ncbi:MAG: hypothetical protein DRQ78_09060 [Epsilonproteobacteria bacterium]|nr:MAG: hypothetical protein DRQ78_09060 [Campylobacterota bacterium]